MTASYEGPPAANGGPGWTVDDSTFAVRLVLVRHQMRWNIKEAAETCRLSATQWAAWEAGSMPRRYVETCQAISESTGADYIWLLTGSRNAPSSSLPQPPPVPRRADATHRPKPTSPRPHPRPKPTKTMATSVA